MAERGTASAGMKGYRNDMPRVVLRSTLGYLGREAARRAGGEPARALRLQDGELIALVEMLRREVGSEGEREGRAVSELAGHAGEVAGK